MEPVGKEIKGRRQLIKFHQGLKGNSATNALLHFTKSHRLGPACLLIQNHLSYSKEVLIGEKNPMKESCQYGAIAVTVAHFLPLT